MREMQRRVHLFTQQGLRVVLDAHAALFQHDIAFCSHIGVGQIEIDHTVGVERHDELQAVARDLLVEGGVVVRGEGVVLTAVAGDGLRELIARHGWRATKHHVLEEVRETREAGRIIHGADAIPQHVRHDRRPVIGDHENLHAILQGELEYLGVLGLHRASGRDRNDRSSQNALENPIEQAAKPAAAVLGFPLAALIDGRAFLRIFLRSGLAFDRCLAVRLLGHQPIMFVRRR